MAQTLYRIKPGFDHTAKCGNYQVEAKPEGASRFGLVISEGKPAAYHDEATAKAHMLALRLSDSLESDHKAVDVKHGAAWAGFYRMRNVISAPPQEQPAEDEVAE